jgi:DNA-binding MarR family transcriptional regulator
VSDKTSADPTLLANELRVVLGRLVRRLRAERRFALSQSAVLGRLDREGPQSVSDLAHSERVRPQSMAQTVGELEQVGLVARRPDPGDRRRALVELTAEGRTVLAAERRRSEGWLAQAIANEMSASERALLSEALEVFRRLAES